MRSPKRSSSSSTWLALVGCVALAGGCVSAVGNVKAPTPDAPAGDQAFRMVPVPSEDDTILGRIVMSEPRAASSFEAEARPNPCVEHLEPEASHELIQEIHRAQKLGGEVDAKATLHGFGFSTNVAESTHLVFDLTTSRKVVRRDTTEYLSCCREHDCGFGYVSTLVYGQGEYASGRATRVAAEADYLGLAGGGGSVNVAASERKQVQGWVLAVVTPHEVLRNMDETRSKAFIAGGAASFALGLGGLGMMVTGLVRGPQLEDMHDTMPDRREEIKGQIRSMNGLAIAGGITGGVFTATGVGLLIVGVRGRQQRRFSFTPTPAGVSFAGRF
ncbi:MAG: hypothetical protein AAF721_20855 [Myxococcota bacterium]